MATWEEFAAAAPEFAARVAERFTTYRHHTMATIRGDGSPRISGTEVDLSDGSMRLGMMLGSRRAADLRRDPRVALHSHSVEPPDDAAAWEGEAKVSGRAIDVTEAPPDGTELQADQFAIDVEEAVLTHIDETGTVLVIEVWTPAKGLVEHTRT